MGGGDQRDCGHDRPIGRTASGDLLGRFSCVHGAFGILGKGDDHISATGNSRYLEHFHWNSFGYLLFYASAFLCVYTTDHGLHADHAGVRLHDSVIAFFGTGKVAAVIITMIFGGTPVVRLTVLGLKGVPFENIREAAIAYGASKWYLLTKVDLPLATPTILAGSEPDRDA